MRLSFVGEMGWELHVPRADCVKVYRAVMQAGARHGIANAGYRAIDSLSIEKGPASPLSTTLCFSSSTGSRARSFSSASEWVGVAGGEAGSQIAENSPVWAGFSQGQVNNNRGRGEVLSWCCDRVSG